MPPQRQLVVLVTTVVVVIVAAWIALFRGHVLTPNVTTSPRSAMADFSASLEAQSRILDQQLRAFQERGNGNSHE